MPPTVVRIHNYTDQVINLMGEHCPDMIHPSMIPEYRIAQLHPHSHSPARMKTIDNLPDPIEQIVLPTGDLFRVFIPNPRQTTNIPPYSEALYLDGLRYLVTAVVASSNPGRRDLYSVARLVRDKRSSQVVLGARAFTTHPQGF